MHIIARFMAGISLIVMMIAALLNTFGWFGLIGYIGTGIWLTLEEIVTRRREAKEQALRDGSLFRSMK